MAIRKSTIEVPIAGGVDTKTDEKLVAPPAMLDIQNCVFTKHGSLRKRNGYSQLGNKDLNGNALTFKLVANRQSELVAVTDEGLYSYIESANVWQRKGDFVPLSMDLRKIADAPSVQYEADHDQNGDIELFAWVDGRGGVWYSIYDQNSKAVIVPETQLSVDGDKPRVITTPSTGQIQLLWIDTNVNDLKVTTFSSANLSGTTATLGKATVHSSLLFDAVYHPTSGAVFWAYHSTANVNQSVEIGWVTPTGAFGPVGSTWTASATVNTTGAVNTTVGLYVGSNGPTSVVTVVAPSSAMFVVDTSQVGETYQLSASAQTATNVSGAVVAFRDNTNKFDLISTSGTPRKKRSFTGTTADGAEAAWIGDNFALASHPFRRSALTSTINSDYYLVLRYQPSFAANQGFQSSHFLVDSDGHILAEMTRGRAYDYATGPRTLPRSAYLQHEITLLDVNRVPVDDDDPDEAVTDPGLVKVEFDFDPIISSTEYNGSLYISGGFTWQYDGMSPIEAGFLLIPELVSTTATAPSGGGTPGVDRLDSSKAYFYAIRPEWTDAQGKRLVGASRDISLGPYAATPPTNDVFDLRFGASGHDEVDFVIEPLVFTRKQSALGRGDTLIKLFRTTGNGVLKYDIEVGGTNDVTSNLSTSDTAILEPDLTSGELGFFKNEFDYTNSGELQNVAPFAAKFLLTHDDRVFYIPNEDQNKVYFSKRPDEFSQPGFNEILYIQAPQDGETITALGVMDNKLVIFKRSKIYLVSGEGPNNLGVGSYTLPRLVSTDTGCKDPRSVVRTPLGLMFQSDKGIYLLNRGEAVEYVGKQVEAYNSQTITAAALLANTNEVRFLSSDERTLVFDYEFGTWTTFTNHEGIDAVVHDGAYHYLTLDGKVRREVPGFYKDVSSSIVVKLKTAWLKPQGMQRYWRCSRIALLGAYGSDHDIRLKTAINYRPYTEYSVVWNPENALSTDVWGGAANWGANAAWGLSDLTKPDSVYQFRHVPKIQKVESIQFTIEEIPPNNPGQGFELTGIALDVGSYSGVFRLPSTKAT